MKRRKEVRTFTYVRPQPLLMFFSRFLSHFQLTIVTRLLQAESILRDSGNLTTFYRDRYGNIDSTAIFFIFGTSCDICLIID